MDILDLHEQGQVAVDVCEKEAQSLFLHMISVYVKFCNLCVRKRGSKSLFIHDLISVCQILWQ